MQQFNPVTTAEQLQVAILGELQQIRTLLEPSKPPADMEPTQPPVDDAAPTDAPVDDKPAASKKPPVKKAATRKRVTGQ